MCSRDQRTGLDFHYHLHDTLPHVHLAGLYPAAAQLVVFVAGTVLLIFQQVCKQQLFTWLQLGTLDISSQPALPYSVRNSHCAT